MTDTPAAYLRTSLEDFNRAHGLADQSQSISNQRKVILEYVQHNPEFSEVQIREFIDDGLTGTNTDRPQFQAMSFIKTTGWKLTIFVQYAKQILLSE